MKVSVAHKRISRNIVLRILLESILAPATGIGVMYLTDSGTLEDLTYLFLVVSPLLFVLKLTEWVQKRKAYAQGYTLGMEAGMGLGQLVGRHSEAHVKGVMDDELITVSFNNDKDPVEDTHPVLEHQSAHSSAG